MILVLANARKGLANLVFSFFLFSLTLWGYTIFMMRFTPDLGQAIWWERITIVFVAATSASFYHFTLRYSIERSSSRFLFIVYLYLVVVIALAPTSLIVKGMTTDVYGNAPIWGLLFPIYIAPIYILVGMAVYELNKLRRKSTSYAERNRLLYFILGAAAVLIAAVTDMLSALGVGIYPGTILANIVFALLTSVAILRYHLFDIQLATYKVTPFLLMAIIVGGIYSSIYFAVDYFGGLAITSVWLYLVLAIGIAHGIQPLWSKIQEWTNMLFYRGRYEHLKALAHLQEEVHSITDLSTINTTLPQLIQKAMQASHLCFLLPAQSMDDFRVTSSAGMSDSDSQTTLSNNSAVIRWLTTHGGLLRREDLEIIPQLQASTMHEKKVLEKLDGDIYIPMRTRERLAGLLVIGPKTSRQPYSWEDERLLKRIASQMALNIENVYLYHASLEREKQLTVISNLNKAIGSSLDIQSTYDVFARELEKVVPVDWASIVLIEDDKLHFFALSTEIHSSWGKPGTIIPLQETATEWVAANKKPLVESDLAQQRRFKTGDNHYYDLGIRSIAYLPLFSQGEVLGSLIVGSAHPDSYNEGEIMFLEQAASQLSLTIENARLYARERGDRARLELLNEQRDEFFRAIAHELKTPLTAIKASGDLLSEELARKRQASLRRMMDNIQRGTDRLETMLNDLLDMAKAQATPLELHRQPLDIPVAIANAAELCYPPIKQKFQSLNLEIPETLPQVMADPERFDYIISNLLSNANKFSREGGKINVTARTENGNVLIEVMDSGPGIPKEEQELIFEPFYRGKFSGERIKGIGVGLATVKQMVKLHNGRVWVDSQLGKGSKFTVSLPLV